MRNRKHNRLKGYDYSKDNLYFVTICVDKMQCCLGDIAECNDEIHEDSISEIKSNRDLDSDLEWEGASRDLSVLREFSNKSNFNDSNPNFNHSNPNQSNQIMQLNNYGKIVLKRLQWLAERYKYVVIHGHIVMPNHVHAIIEIDSLLIPDVGIKIKSLSELIGAFKSTSSKLIHDQGLLDFKWKRSFHDNIVRDGKAFKSISNYIINNPSNWKLDNLNPAQ